MQSQSEITVGTDAFELNEEPRLPFLFLLDVSSSTRGKMNQEMNAALPLIPEEIRRDLLASQRVELGAITFGDTVEVLQDFATVDQCSPWQVKASGSTPMGEAIHRGLDMIDSRKQLYRLNGIPFYRPTVALLTDGEPTDEWRSAADRIEEYERLKKATFFIIGLEGADKKKLTQIAPSRRPPLMLAGLKFRELFQWLSASVATCSVSETGGTNQQTKLPPVDTWALVSTD